MSTHRLALGTVLVTLLLIVFGGYVASSESGMGCGPDWPLCNGVLVPALHGETLIEYTHRVIGALLAVLSVLLLIKVRRSQTAASVRRAADGMALLLAAQIVLGALVVVLDLPAIVVTLHLVIAMVYLAVLLFLWRTTHPANRPADRPIPSSLINHASLLSGLILVTIALGAYVKHRAFGLSCGWLACGDSWLPSTEEQLFQTLHRLLAFGAAVYFVLFAAMIARSPRFRITGLRTRLIAITALLLMQSAVGAIAILADLPIAWAVIHLAIATCLFAVSAELRVWLGINR